ncbi:MAG: hypothetical protein Q7W44_09440 [Coriobacteriia bacterium]|nr:hypothetical protein [Coriobacteriia bacterium]
MRLVSTLIAVALLLGGLAGCGSGGAAPEVSAVQSTVGAYNEALIRAFETMDMNELNATATEDQALAEYYLMAALGEGRVRMLATLVSIEFGDVVFPAEEQASVTTTEVWDYAHESLDTSETVRAEQGVVYHLRYDLVLQDGRWLVDRVTSLDGEPAVGDPAP